MQKQTKAIKIQIRKYLLNTWKARKKWKGITRKVTQGLHGINDDDDDNNEGNRRILKILR